MVSTVNSGFPGMDPFMERHWPDVRSALIAEARRTLNRLLPIGLAARAEERLAVESVEDRPHRIAPDVRVFSPSVQPASATAGAVTIDAPNRLEVNLDIR